jgi:hypothetical protein
MIHPVAAETLFYHVVVVVVYGLARSRLAHSRPSVRPTKKSFEWALVVVFVLARSLLAHSRRHPSVRPATKSFEWASVGVVAVFDETVMVIGKVAVAGHSFQSKPTWFFVGEVRAIGKAGGFGIDCWYSTTGAGAAAALCLLVVGGTHDYYY